MALKPDLKPAFLAALRQWPVVQHACDAIGISRRAAYDWRNADKDFAADWDDAIESGVDRAEQEAFRRAVAGVEEPVVYQGQLTPVWERDANGQVVLEDFATGDLHPKGHPQAGQPVIGRRAKQARDANGNPAWLTIRKHSDTLLSLVLKGRRKQVFAERTELTGADGKDLTPVDETARTARIAQLLAAASSRRNVPADGSDLV